MVTGSFDAGEIRRFKPLLPGSAPCAAPPGGLSPVLVLPFVPPLMSMAIGPLRTTTPPPPPPPPLCAALPPKKESPPWPPPALTVNKPLVQFGEITTALPPAAPAPAASLSGLVLATPPRTSIVPLPDKDPERTKTIPPPVPPDILARSPPELPFWSPAPPPPPNTTRETPAPPKELPGKAARLSPVTATMLA